METRKRKKRPSYTARLMQIGVGESVNFRLIGAAYTNFYTAKRRLEVSKRATFKMAKATEQLLCVTRLS